MIKFTVPFPDHITQYFPFFSFRTILRKSERNSPALKTNAILYGIGDALIIGVFNPSGWHRYLTAHQRLHLI